jgi:cytochrome c
MTTFRTLASANRINTRRASVLAGTLLTLALLVACGDGSNQATPAAIPGGDPERGRQALIAYECNTCHRIPGLQTTDGRSAPALTVWPNRAFVAGMPNTPDNVIAFIQDPQRYRPGTEMPDVGVTDEDARDIAAYLFSLR